MTRDELDFIARDAVDEWLLNGPEDCYVFEREDMDQATEDELNYAIKAMHDHVSVVRSKL